jgi:hypothetical protein
MARFATLMLAFVLSGAVAVAGTLSLCPPMPCCVVGQAEMDTSSPNCCVLTEAPSEQPRNTPTKMTVDPELNAVDSVSINPLQMLPAVSMEASLASSPPSLHRRLATLSTLLI